MAFQTTHLQGLQFLKSQNHRKRAYSKGPKIEKFQDRPSGLNSSSELENFKRASHQNGGGELWRSRSKFPSEIELFQSLGPQGTGPLNAAIAGRQELQKKTMAVEQLLFVPFVQTLWRTRGLALVGGHPKPVQIKLIRQIFRIFCVLVSAFAAFSLCGTSSDPCFFFSGERGLPHFCAFRVRFEDLESPTDQLFMTVLRWPGMGDL